VTAQLKPTKPTRSNSVSDDDTSSTFVDVGRMYPFEKHHVSEEKAKKEEILDI
jgi:hypothetical protein